MKGKKDQIIKDNHHAYKEFLQSQYVVDLDQGDKVKIQTFNKDGDLLDEKEFEAKYINSHINIIFQDKGLKTNKEVE